MIRSYARQAGFIALLILALTLPFELETPWLRLGPLVLTNVELVAAAVLALALLAGPAASGPELPRMWLFLAVWFIVGMALAAWLAPGNQLNAFKATIRTIQGILLVSAVLRLAPNARQGKWVVLALLTGGFVAAIIGLTEHVVGYDFPWLTIFRREATYAGPFLRLSGSFDYANQAAMFLEATLPFLFALLIAAVRSRRWVAAGVGLIALIAYIQALILTFSRAGFMSLLLACVLVALLLFWRRRDWRPALVWAGLAAGVAGLVAANWLVSPIFRLRLQSDVDSEWYRSEIVVPAELSLEAGSMQEIDVVITNRGALPWQPDGPKPFLLGARWQTADGRSELAEHSLWPLARPVSPGETQTLVATVEAPWESGAYRLVWDMLHKDVNWFDARGDAQTITRVTVLANADPVEGQNEAVAPLALAEPTVFDAPLPGRRVLWTIAGQLIRDHPLTGIGLDNYRLTYSYYVTDDPMPGTALDQTVHSNNWYLETLVSVGLVGTAPFLLWIAHLIWTINKRLNNPRPAPLQIAAGVGILIFFIHGLLDYFLLFNATALLFWIITALWLIFTHDNARV